MTPPSVAAAFLGGYFGQALPSRALLALIAVLLLWNGLDLVFGFRAAPEVRRPRRAAVVSGAAVGLLGGAVGLILGTLRMPALVRSVGLSPHAAVGTNPAVGFLLGAAGFAGHLARLEVEWAVLGASLGGAIPGAWFGVRVTTRFSEQTLRKAIGVALVAVAVAVVVGAAR